MQIRHLFLILAVAAVNSEVIDLNSQIDHGLAKANELIRLNGSTSANIPAGAFGSRVKFSQSVGIGYDSLTRTGNCTLNIEGRDQTFDIHVGFTMLEQFFPSLEIDGNAMSASYRIQDNSIHLGFTIHNDTNCHVTLNDLGYERLAKVEFYASRPEYDRIDVEHFFEKEVLPTLNRGINKTFVEKQLQVICKQHSEEYLGRMPFFHMFVKDHAVGLYHF